MAKNPKIKIRLKTDIESLADVISDKVTRWTVFVKKN